MNRDANYLRRLADEYQQRAERARDQPLGDVCRELAEYYRELANRIEQKETFEQLD